MATTLEQERIECQLCWLIETDRNEVFPFKYVVNNDVYYVGHRIHGREMFRLTYWFNIVKAPMINGKDVMFQKISDIIGDEPIVCNDAVREEILFEHSYDIRQLAELYNSTAKTKIELPKSFYEDDFLKACRKIIKGVIRNGLIQPTEINWDVFKTEKDGK